ncbi:MAG: DUF6531 domain-containing protein [Deltaproteobacteria bacterium]
MRENRRVLLMMIFVFSLFSSLIYQNSALAETATLKKTNKMSARIITDSTGEKKTNSPSASLQIASTAALTGSVSWGNAFMDPGIAYVSSTDSVGYYINLYGVQVGDCFTWTSYNPVLDPATDMPTGEFEYWGEGTWTRIDSQSWQFHDFGSDTTVTYAWPDDHGLFCQGPAIMNYQPATQYPGTWKITISHAGQEIASGTFTLVDDLAPQSDFLFPMQTTLSGSQMVWPRVADNLAVIKTEVYADNLSTGQSYLLKTYNCNSSSTSFFFYWDTYSYPDGSYNLRSVVYDPYNNKGTYKRGYTVANNLVPQSGSVTSDKMTLTADPINIATGESYFSSKDFSLGTRGPRLDLFRKYRSFSTETGMFGYGWRTDVDVNLIVDRNGNLTIYDWEGTAVYFTNNSGTYTPSPGNHSTIIKNADNTFTLTDKAGIVTHYDGSGRLSSRTDRNGNTLTFVYNPSLAGGTYIQDASGRQIKLNLDTKGRVSSAVDPAGNTYQYGYDKSGNLISVTDPEGKVTKYSYDSNHKIIQLANANGHNTYYQYDASGRATMNWQDNNVNKIALSFQANNTTVVTDSLGNNNTYVFNSVGLLTSHTDPLGAATQQTWDVFLNRLSVTDARNNVTKFEYDIRGNPVLITDPLGNKTRMTYTPDFNLISSKTDALGNVTDFTYDNKGNLLTVTDALANKHSFVYDQFGDVIISTDSRGNSTHFNYDALGHMFQETDALGNNKVLTYK